MLIQQQTILDVSEKFNGISCFLDDESETEKNRVPRFKSVVLIARIFASFMKTIKSGKFDRSIKRGDVFVMRAQGSKAVLEATDKSLLRKHPQDRLPHERRHLVTLLTSMPCFLRYPLHIRKQLALVTYFMQFPANKVLIQEGHLASAMYFILEGEILVARKEFDQITNTYVDRNIGVLGVGDIFGEVALLDRIARTATCISSTNVELLCIFSKDFDNILRKTLKFQWDQVHLAANEFIFFKNWTEVQLRELCILAKIRQYEPHSTIYFQDRGLLNFVHFIISGECTVIQCLEMRVKSVGNRRTYQLVNLDTMKSSSDDFIANINKSDSKVFKNKEMVITPQHTARRISGKYENIDLALENVLDFHKDIDEIQEQPFVQPFISKDSDLSDRVEKKGEIQRELLQVGTYTAGGVFGLGERMEHRVVVAKTVVQCLVIPQYWLFHKEQNIDNVWARIKSYVDMVLPTREDAFKFFLGSFKWNRYKKKIIDGLPKLSSNTTRIEDVPICIRIMEGTGDNCS